jgi:hypothetical protein
MPNRKKEIKKKTFNFSLTPSTIDLADKMSMKDGDSRSSFVEKLIKHEAERRKQCSQ